MPYRSNSGHILSTKCGSGKRPFQTRCGLIGRLTNWRGSVTNRPKYWENLVMKLVYAYLDPDVAKGQKENPTRPQKGQNYHQWLTSQYGLKILVEHIWMLVGIAKTCSSLEELKHKMERMFGQGEFQYDYSKTLDLRRKQKLFRLGSFSHDPHSVLALI